MDVPADLKLTNNLWFAYNAILQIVPYLDQMDLLELAQVCRLWREVISLMKWESVRLENKTIDLNFFVDFLAEQNTTKLTLIDCNLFTQKQESLFEELQKITSLQTIVLSKYRPHCFAGLHGVNRDIEEVYLNVLNDGSKMDLKCLAKFINLKKLDLNFENSNGAFLASIETLNKLEQLHYLSLSNVSNLSKLDFGSLDVLSKLSTLELGDCHKIPPSVYEDMFKKTVSLKKLRLEKPNFHGIVTNMVINGRAYKTRGENYFKELPSLESLELVYPDSSFFYEDVIPCENLKDFMIVLSENDNEVCGELPLFRESHITSFVVGVTSKLFDKLVRTSLDDPEKVFEFFNLYQSGETRLWKTIVERNFDKFISQFKEVIREILPDIVISVIEYHEKWEKCNNMCEQYRKSLF